MHPGQLKDFFVMAEELPLAGFSVTIPHKQKILRYLDWVDPVARRIGAVNTVWRKAGKWRGANTDAPGVTSPLERHVRLNKSSVLVVGNGGAARGAVFALAAAGSKLAVTGRNLDRVRALASTCGAEALSRDQAAARTFDALVHATPLGMSPNVEKCFFDGRIPSQAGVRHGLHAQGDDAAAQGQRSGRGSDSPGWRCSWNRPGGSSKSSRASVHRRL